MLARTTVPGVARLRYSHRISKIVQQDLLYRSLVFQRLRHVLVNSAGGDDMVYYDSFFLPLPGQPTTGLLVLFQ
jgi:hypothetical protein